MSSLELESVLFQVWYHIFHSQFHQSETQNWVRFYTHSCVKMLMSAVFANKCGLEFRPEAWLCSWAFILLKGSLCLISKKDLSLEVLKPTRDSQNSVSGDWGGVDVWWCLGHQDWLTLISAKSFGNEVIVPTMPWRCIVLFVFPLFFWAGVPFIFLSSMVDNYLRVFHKSLENFCLF